MAEKYFGIFYRDVNGIDRFDVAEYDEYKMILAKCFGYTDLCMLKNESNREIVKQVVEAILKKYPEEEGRRYRIYKYGLTDILKNDENYIAKYKHAILAEIEEFLRQEPDNGHYEEEEGRVFVDNIFQRTGFIPKSAMSYKKVYADLMHYRENGMIRNNNILESWRGLSLSQAALYMLLIKGYLFESDIIRDLDEICNEMKACRFEKFAKEVRDCFENQISLYRNLILLGETRIDELRTSVTVQELQTFIKNQETEDEELQKLSKFCESYLEYMSLESRNQNIAYVGYSIHTFHWLRRANIQTLGEISDMTRADVTGIRYLNTKHVDEIEQVLNEYGLAFAKWE